MTTTLQRVAFELLISIKNVYRQLHCNEMVTSALDAYRNAPSMLLPPCSVHPVGSVSKCP